ncbi:DNA-(apurinic or apyrimidinic site) lyase /endonuclease III [Verrucomicrobium sp. GAS474]|uniref:endonuclease III n=1 Tax=Verrucomicrobium sp. GAS474 TaxID=1882831 RepID=UPI00087B2FA5|nr:endonuclease III [Verrucomicrobium sp. GAS474]SDU21948.1 DNA-(apurinic or apyrimidinic site) lyase /endonuclease III [Verrucomicrobium sp. GAS474]
MATSAQARVPELVARLRAAYPDAHCELDFKTPFQLLIATILSAQCTDVLVNRVTPGLFAAYPSPAALAAAPVPEVEQAIKRIGLYRNKAKNIVLCAQALVRDHGGEVPRTMEELTALAGVGRKTANVVLGNAFGIESGVVVDTHVARLSNRLALVRGELDPVKIEKVLQRLIPRAEWTLFSHLLIWHGRRRCMARNPDCPHCEVADLCPKRGVPKAKGPAKAPKKTGAT